MRNGLQRLFVNLEGETQAAASKKLSQLEKVI